MEPEYSSGHRARAIRRTGGDSLARPRIGAERAHAVHRRSHRARRGIDVRAAVCSELRDRREAPRRSGLGTLDPVAVFDKRSDIFDAIFADLDRGLTRTSPTNSDSLFRATMGYKSAGGRQRRTSGGWSGAPGDSRRRAEVSEA